MKAVLPALFLAVAAASSPALAEGDVTIADRARKELLDALRPAVEQDLGQPVRFVVRKLRVEGGWAFAYVRPQTPDGRPIDFTKTRHAERVEAGVFDGDDLFALLQRKAGRWTVREFVIGPTDVAYAAWPDDYGVSYELIGLAAP
jgi:hypothetical protein